MPPRDAIIEIDSGIINVPVSKILSKYFVQTSKYVLYYKIKTREFNHQMSLLSSFLKITQFSSVQQI